MKLRQLTESEIVSLASRKGVKKMSVENFLGTMGDDAMGASMNAAADAKSYKWNPATAKAVRDGIALAKRPAPTSKTPTEKPTAEGNLDQDGMNRIIDWIDGTI